MLFLGSLMLLPIQHSVDRMLRRTSLPGYPLRISGDCIANFMQAELHQWRPTMRFCRYRDLARSIWGELVAVLVATSFPYPLFPAAASNWCAALQQFRIARA